jgi:hypothetical protein
MPPKQEAAAAAPSKEKQLFAAMKAGNEDEAIRLINEGADVNRQGLEQLKPINYALKHSLWRVFEALLDKVKIKCTHLQELINEAIELDNIEPFRQFLKKQKAVFESCVKNSIELQEDPWGFTFYGGSLEFIKKFIDAIDEFDRPWLNKPAGLKNPEYLGLTVPSHTPESEAIIVAGMRYLYSKRGVNINTKEQNPFKKLIFQTDIDGFNLASVKRAIAIGADINLPIYSFIAGKPTSDLLSAILPLPEVSELLGYVGEVPIRLDPNTDLLSFLLENTVGVKVRPSDYLIWSNLREVHPNIILRFILFYAQHNLLGPILDEPQYAGACDCITLFIYVLIRNNKWSLVERIINAYPQILNKLLMYSNRTKGFTLLQSATHHNKIDIVRRLLALGADTTIRDTNGKNACDYAREKNYSAELIALVCPPEVPWRGLMQSNVQKYNYIFEEDRANKPRSEAENNSFCPVCLTDAYRSVACNHMQHNCAKDSPGRYHKALYDRFKDPAGNVHWCTLCGRICIGYVDGDTHAFIHYELASAADAAAGKAQPFNPTGRKISGPGGVHIQGDPYTHNCSLTVDDHPDRLGQPIPPASQSGGGGLREKFLRIHRLRQYAYALRNANMTDKEAYKRLIEQVWNAPLVGQLMNRPELAAIKGPNSWNVPTNAFRAPNVAANVKPDERPVPPEASYADVRRSGCEAERTLIVFEGTNSTSLNNLSKEVPGCQFRHMEEDEEGRPTGTMNLHKDTPFLLTTVWSRIAAYNTSFGDDKVFAKCIDPDNCKARIFPEDLEPLLDEKLYTSKADYEAILKVYARYKELFNWKFGGARLAEGIKPGGEPGPAAVLIAADGAAAGAGGAGAGANGGPEPPRAGAGGPEPGAAAGAVGVPVMVAPGEIVIHSVNDPRLNRFPARVREAMQEDIRRYGYVIIAAANNLIPPAAPVRNAENLVVRLLANMRQPQAAAGGAPAAAAQQQNGHQINAQFAGLANLNEANRAAIQAALEENLLGGGKRRTRRRKNLMRRGRRSNCTQRK